MEPGLVTVIWMRVLDAKMRWLDFVLCPQGICRLFRGSDLGNAKEEANLRDWAKIISWTENSLLSSPHGKREIERDAGSWCLKVEEQF